MKSFATVLIPSDFSSWGSGELMINHNNQIKMGPVVRSDTSTAKSITSLSWCWIISTFYCCCHWFDYFLSRAIYFLCLSKFSFQGWVTFSPIWAPGCTRWRRCLQSCIHVQLIRLLKVAFGFSFRGTWCLEFYIPERWHTNLRHFYETNTSFGGILQG